jgi:YidC/Oxa1 family membrane protein insertase
LPEIHNPNLQTQGSGGGGGGGGDMRSTMLFMLVVVMAVLGYQYFFNKPTPNQTQPAAQTQSQQATQPQPAQQSAATAAQAAVPMAPAAAATPAITAALETDTTVENELYKIEFTNRGAQVKHWILKRFSDTAGKPLDMVQPQASAQFGLPLSLFAYEPELTAQLNGALYQLTVAGEQPTATGLVQAPNAITYHYAANGLDVVKTFRFDSSYLVTIETSVKRNGVPVRALVEWPAGLGDMEEFRQSSMLRAQTRTPSYFAWSLDGKQDSLAAAKVSGDNTTNAPYQYAAVSDLYFASAFLPDTPDSATVVTLHHTIDLPVNLSDPNSKKTPADVLGVAVGSTGGATQMRLFVGPKATEVLGAVHSIGPDGKADGPSLESLIQYGWMTVVAKPLYLALRFLRDRLGPGANNWGWAIIIFTTAFTVIMLPFRFMAMKSSLKMMRIQPKVDAIKKRYAHLKATDPKRADMNTEMMALYKVEGFNPYGSCLPMLPQIPLFIAYYHVLQAAVELRQAHWFWLPDLSAPDPTYILPILIIVSMFLVQVLTPSPGMDPNQRRMMAIMMPIVFGFMLLHYASGLALYWGTSNLINLALQVGVNQSKMGKEMHAISARRSGKKPPPSQGRK